MSCNHIREALPDLAAGHDAPPEVSAHLNTCTGCAEVLAGIRETMALMDAWQAPEPSPYFDVRLQARLREEKQKQSTGWFAWLRKPIVGLAAVALLTVGVGLMRGGLNLDRLSSQKQGAHNVAAAPRGTAVGDLEFLDKHAEVLQDFEALDDDDSQIVTQ